MPRLRRKPKTRIADPIPLSYLRWAQILLKTGDGGRAMDESGVSPFVDLDERAAPILVRAVKAGKIEVSETAEMDAYQTDALMERLLRSRRV